MQGQRVLVTGGGGFVGRHLISRLIDAGSRVTVLDRAQSTLLPDVLTVLGSTEDEEFLLRVVEDVAPHHVFHLASARERTVEAGAFRRALRSDLLGTLNLLLAVAGRPEVESVVMIGSAEEYGANLPPCDEGRREAPINAYSLSKVCGTHAAQSLYRAHGVPAVILRPAIIYGPGAPTDMLVGQLLAAARDGRSLPMTNGEQRREFIFVSDAVEAVIAAALSRAARGRIINLGSGAPIRLRDLVKLVEGITQMDGLARLGEIPYRSGEIFDYGIDSRLAGELLGWHARTSLEEGIRQTWNALTR